LAKWLRDCVLSAQFLRLELSKSRQNGNKSGSLAVNGTRFAACSTLAVCKPQREVL
jgi:hypothetical protein